MIDVVIVGGGVVGLCSAYELLLAGKSVVVLEAENEGFRGCSWGNAGYLVPSHVAPLSAPGMIELGMKLMLKPGGAFSITKMLFQPGWLLQFAKNCTQEHSNRVSPLIRDLNIASRELYRQWDQDWHGSFGFRQSGLLMVCQKESTLAHEIAGAEVALELGLDSQVLDLDGIRNLQPGVEIKAMGGIHYSCDGMIFPGRFLEVLRERIRELGGEIRYGSRVSGWVRSGHKILGVLVGDEVIESHEYVLAAGSWSEKVARQLRLALPLVPGKGISFRLDDPPASLTLPMLMVEARVAATPLDNGIRFGGTMALGDWSSGVSQSRMAGMKTSVARFLPQFRPEHFRKVVDEWSGLRPCTPDGLPVIGRASSWDNLTLATGHAMMGMSLGPVTGRLVSEIVLGKKPSVPINALSIDRFKV